MIFFELLVVQSLLPWSASCVNCTHNHFISLEQLISVWLLTHWVTLYPSQLGNHTKIYTRVVVKNCWVVPCQSSVFWCFLVIIFLLPGITVYQPAITSCKFHFQIENALLFFLCHFTSRRSRITWIVESSVVTVCATCFSIKEFHISSTVVLLCSM
jgi:hypothetical protein